MGIFKIFHDSKSSASSKILMAIIAARLALHAQIETAGGNGIVVDALPLALFENHRDELAEHRRQLQNEDQRYRATVERLASMFPEAPPAPEPTAPRPPRNFPRIGKLLGQQRPPGMLH